MSTKPYVGSVHYEPRPENKIQVRTNMSQRDKVNEFELGRIRVLQEERLHIQKKTFTKWMNSFLSKVRMEVEDLFVDLADGKKLLKLLELISGEKLPKPNNGRMRVHKVENVNKSLAFLHTKVRLESIGAEDIVDGNPRLILGLIWTIILRFQIQEIEIDVDEENESSEKKSAKDALLLWAQRKTRGYQGVNIQDFSSSWRNGLGFNALIHSHRPDLFEYEKLMQNKNIDNLNHAFNMANDELGIPSILDAEDIDNTRPDEKSIMTYVASYYHTFARMKNEEKSGRRIAKIIHKLADLDKKKISYDSLFTNLLGWIQKKIVELEDRNFPNSIEGIQTLMAEFMVYRTKEKPPKYNELSEIEALYFNINTQLKELKQAMFNPAEGKLVQDIERAWEQLKRAEHRREVDLRNELLRQQKLELLNFKFDQKRLLREGYLKEMMQVLSDPRYGSNFTQVEATKKKHEAISTDILERETRIHDLSQMAKELEKENYRDAASVKIKEAEIMKLWNAIRDLLNKHKDNLNRMSGIMILNRDIETALASILHLRSDLNSIDTGNHLIAVEELLHRHALQELQISSLGETEKKLKRQAEQLNTVNPKEQEIIEKNLKELSNAYADLCKAGAIRKAILEEARNFYQFLQDQEDEESWLIEKQRICQAGITAKDLRGVLSLQQKHKALMDEIKARKNKYDQLGATGKQLIGEKHPRSAEIHQHLNQIINEWELLDKLADERAKQLQDAAEAYEFYADANEADSWLHEKIAIVRSSDYGSDEPSAQALLQRHKDLEGEVKAYGEDVDRLNSQAEKLVAAGIPNLFLNQQPVSTEPVEEVTYEERLIPTEVYEDVPVEKVEYKIIREEKKVPQVKALYPFDDHGFRMSKGEVMVLLNNNNPDWWCVRKLDGTSEGFAPANYVQVIEPRVVSVPVKKAETIKTIQRKKVTKMVKTKVPIKKINHPRQVQRKVDDNDSVPKRQTKINDTYDELKVLTDKRHSLLDDAVRLFQFYKECDDIEKWIKDSEKLLFTDDPGDNVLQAKRKYEKFLTDFSGNSKRMEELGANVKDFEKQNHSQIDKVHARHRQIQQAWKRLERLKETKEKSLEGASSVELYNKLCDEAKDWMTEKMMQLDTEVLGHDLKTVQALQRRHDNLERELAPVEDKVKKVKLLAQQVQSSYPNEKQNVKRTEKQIDDLWDQVVNKAIERRARLEDAVGQQIFTNSYKDLLRWVTHVKEQLNADNIVRDVQTAETLLKNHQDLKHDIKAKDDEFNQVASLGNKLMKNNPNITEVPEHIMRLNEEQAAIARGWNEKDKWLKQCLQLQKFNKEADKIDASTSAAQAVLEYPELGNSLDEVEVLVKQHRTFMNTLAAQDERVNGLSKTADALIAEEHYETKGIDSKRNQVIKKREAVKVAAQKRNNALDASKNFQEFCAEVHDLRVWMADKQKTASDESYRDLANLERKIQKHEAFERELRANEGQLRTVNKLGQALIAQESFKKDEVAKTLHDLNDKWQKLANISLEKGRCLRQAEIQQNYNNAISDVQNKLEEIEGLLKSDDVGKDLRSCRDLLNRHELLEADLSQCKKRIDDLLDKSNDLRDEGHFDADGINELALASQQRLSDLEDPVNHRKTLLKEALKFYEFGFALDAELQWIKEHLPQASSTEFGKNLHQTQNLHKKHIKLEAEIVGHRPVIRNTLDRGEDLINHKHPNKKNIAELCATLEQAWKELEDKAADRLQKLDLALKAQQYFFEANEVESWLNEKDNIVASTDYGRDRDAASKLLTKHKAIELELDTYNNIVSEMGHGAQAMIKSDHPDSKLIGERQNSLEHLVRKLQKKTAVRQHRLMESLFRHEYFAESAELERWIADNLQQASSEDYGQDYEHLIVLKTKFEDFQRQIEAGQDRFKQCEDLAQKLIDNKSPYSSDIEDEQQHLDMNNSSEATEAVLARHEQIRAAWQNLHDQMNKRDAQLQAAGEIHRFHRDVNDALQRIHEKNAALGTDLGRDLNSALALLRKHEAFENELVVLEAQLQVLVEDASKLQKLYPSNKSSIQKQQENVVNDWDMLKQKSDLRKEKLQASVDVQKFLTQVRDLKNWAHSLRLDMSAEEPVRSVARVQLLKSEHEAVKGEIEAREANFEDLANNLEAMEQTGHYAAAEAAKRYEILIKAREDLHTAWQRKKIYLDQLLDLHVFLRETKLIEDATNVQETTLNKTDFGETVDEVTNQLKKHEEFEKLVQLQDRNVDVLVQTGNKLLGQNHFDSQTIADKLVEIQKRRRHIHDLCKRKQELLMDSLLYAEFNRDVSEAKVWIAEKQKKLEVDLKIGEVSNLEDKIKKLQKHQAFQAEVKANTSRIEKIMSSGIELANKNHQESPEIAKQAKELDVAWRQLLQEMMLRGRGLEEAQDILEFNNQLDKLETWIRDKEVMIQAGDTGKDYEHCQQLQRKLDDDMKIDDTRIQDINALANKLSKQGHSGVTERRDNFIKKWQSLQGALEDYRNKLAAALDIHVFDRDIADTSERIAEKHVTLSSEDVGKDLPAVEGLLRKQEALESEVKAVEEKIIHDHQKNAILLSEQYPANTDHLQSKLESLSDNWNKLKMAEDQRKNALRNAYIHHKFLSEVGKLDQFVDETIKRMNANQDPRNISEVQDQLEAHNELRAEIDGRNQAFKEATEHIKNFPGKNHPQILENIEHVQSLQERLDDAWQQRKQDLSNQSDVQRFKDQANQLNGLLASKEAFLNNDDVGDTPRNVEILLRKHEDFENTTKQQLSKVKDLEQEAKKIIERDSNSHEVLSKLQSILNRKNKLLEKSENRKEILKKSKALQEFLRNLNEIQSWIDQKLQIAGDENYREPTNLQSKIQKHATFEAEVFASGERIQNVVEEGKELIGCKHYASDDIALQLDDLENDWKHLQELSNLKRDRLNEAHQALLINRTIDEFETWLDDIEEHAKSTDTGKDLPSANNLLKRHQAIEKNFHQHSENCEAINEASEQFTKSGHFMSEEIKDRSHSCTSRYDQLKSPLISKRDDLEYSVILQQLIRDIDDELQWLDDREPLAASKDLGKTLSSVQILKKKHQALEAELASRQSIITSLIKRANNVVRSPNAGSEIVNSKTVEIKEKFANISDLASIRRLRLQDSLEAQTFYQEVSEAEAWINDKYPLLVSKEVGKDETTAQSLKRKLQGVFLELQGFKPTIDKINKVADNLIEREHFDVKNIEAKKNEVVKQFATLSKLVTEREVRLSEALQYFGFVQEYNELQEWMKDQQIKTDSDDYGNDLEHVELLIQAFETFYTSFANSEPRIQSCVENGNIIMESKSSYSPDVKAKVEEVKLAWKDLCELVAARREALAGAKKVHLFDRTAEEIISWIEEKVTEVNYNNYDLDSEAVAQNIRRHQALENEMKIIRDKIESIKQDADRLIEEFPDTKDHIDDKVLTTEQAWEDLTKTAEHRKNHLFVAEQLQSYFDKYHDLLAFINEMLAKITAPDLPQEISEATLLIDLHNEYKIEIDRKHPEFQKFYADGETLVKESHIFSNDIKDKIAVLINRMEILYNIWQQRYIIYDQNLDVVQFKSEANALDNWLAVREETLKENTVGENILHVEDLIRKHGDFEETIKAQEEKFENLKRRTKVEEAFAQQLRRENLARKVEKERVEQERIETRKRMEMQRIAEQRTKEQYKAPKETPEERVNGNHHKPYVPANDIPSAPSVRKTNSINSFDREKTRRGTEHTVKRAESMRVAPAGRPPKRTPSFNTRRRGSKVAENISSFQPILQVEVENFLDRKQLLTSGGKKSSSRTWKNSYAVLCGQLLCFFKNKDDFLAKKATCPPINIHNSMCSVADDYHKRKHTFRLHVTDDSEYLFACSTEPEMWEWINKIKFRARLDPSQQLISFDISKDHEFEISSQSSRTSSPDVVDTVTLRHDPTFTNGSASSGSSRHTLDSTYSPQKYDNNHRNSDPQSEKKFLNRFFGNKKRSSNM
ncbi:unnamed protein product [Brassicogethes aeneus]|uniref:Karst n=1 Tax=Brassicogethes aeneus TaxID=1431903 RepID=A0A9P0B2U0_BRAAE|nr:unnamed protein product [Brassicogethes aeneus]